MPTARKRHSITETAEVERALDRLRVLAPQHRIDLGELVILGAQRKLAELESTDTEARAQELADLVRSGGLRSEQDLVADAREARASWIRSAD